MRAPKKKAASMRQGLAGLMLLGWLSACAARQPVYFSETVVWEPVSNEIQFAFWRLEPDNQRQERLFDIEGTVAFELSPDGQRIAAIITHPDGQGHWPTDLVVRELETGRSRILKAGSEALSIWEVKWSPDRTQLAYIYTLEADGKIFQTNLALLDVKSGYSFDLNAPGQFKHISYPAWSPDGRWLVMNTVPVGEPSSRLVLYDLSRRRWRLLPQQPASTFNTWGFHGETAWLPDGQSFLFRSFWSGHENLHLYDLATGTAFQLTTMSRVFGSKLSPDGKWILFRASCEKPADCGLFRDGQAVSQHQLSQPIRYGLFVIRSDGTGLKKLASFTDYADLLSYDWYIGKTGLNILFSLSKVQSCRFFTTNPEGDETSCF